MMRILTPAPTRIRRHKIAVTALAIGAVVSLALAACGVYVAGIAEFENDPDVQRRYLSISTD